MFLKQKIKDHCTVQQILHINKKNRNRKAKKNSITNDLF